MPETVSVAVIAVAFNVALFFRRSTVEEDIATLFKFMRAAKLLLQAALAVSAIPLPIGLALFAASAVASLYETARRDVPGIVAIAVFDVIAAAAIATPIVPALVELLWAGMFQPTNT